MAQRDLDAALQLLANRAQYITGASGAAIALRRDGKKDMLCRASSGTNAPQLGALLSTEFGLSGESVRTKHALRCDDALSDVRMNREICRELGIASVVVMPVVNDDQVLGVFEIFSARANAFGERDLSAVQRLSEMVEAAIRLAQTAPDSLDQKRAKAAAAGIAGSGDGQEGQFVADIIPGERSAVSESGRLSPAVSGMPLQATNSKSTPAFSPNSPALPALGSAKKPVFWSAPVDSDAESITVPNTDQSHVPPVLRDLRKCAACGFPVSAGRSLCVECEEKKWRGQLRPQPGRLPVADIVSTTPKMAGTPAAPVTAKVTASGPSVSTTESTTAALPASVKSGLRDSGISEGESKLNQPSESFLSAGPAEFTLSSGIAPSQTWLARNKYLVIVLLVMATAASAVYFLR